MFTRSILACGLALILSTLALGVSTNSPDKLIGGEALAASAPINMARLANSPRSPAVVLVKGKRNECSKSCSDGSSASTECKKDQGCECSCYGVRVAAVSISLPRTAPTDSPAKRNIRTVRVPA